MGMVRTKTCGDCIHADICKEVNGGWFSPKNIAYCTAFKERKNCVEVVRCKDCKHWTMGYCNNFAYYDYEPMTNEDDFCSYGERREGE